MIDHISCNIIDQFSTYDALPFVHHRDLYTIKIEKNEDVTNYITSIDMSNDVVVDSNGFYIKFPTSISEYPIYGQFAKSYYVDQNFSEVKFDDITILKEYTYVNSKSIVIQGGYASGLNSIALGDGSVYGENSFVHGKGSNVTNENSAGIGFGLTDQIRQIKLKEIDNNCYDVVDNRKLYWRGDLEARRYNCSVVKNDVVKNVTLTFAIFEQNFIYHIDGEDYDSVIVLIPTPSETRLMIGNYNYPIDNSYFEIGNGTKEALKTIFYVDSNSVNYGSYTSSQSKTILKSTLNGLYLGDNYLIINDNNLSINAKSDLVTTVTRDTLSIGDFQNYSLSLNSSSVKYSASYGNDFTSILVDNTSANISHSKKIDMHLGNLDAFIKVDADGRSQFEFHHTSSEPVVISETSNINELYVSSNVIALNGNVPPNSSITINYANDATNNISTLYFNGQFSGTINDRFGLFNNGLAKSIQNLYTNSSHTGIYYSQTDLWSNVILAFKDKFTYRGKDFDWLQAIVTDPSGGYFEYRISDKQYSLTHVNKINPRGTSNIKCGFIFATSTDSSIVFSNEPHFSIIDILKNTGPGTFKQTVGSVTNRYNWTGLDDISNYSSHLKVKYARGNEIESGYRNSLVEIFFDAYNLFEGSFSRCKSTLSIAGNSSSLMCGILIEIDEPLCEGLSSRLEEIAVSYNSRANSDDDNERDGQVVESSPNNATGSLTDPNNPQPWRSLEMYGLTYSSGGKTYIFIINADDYNGILRYILMPGEKYTSAVSMVDESLSNASDPAVHLGGRGGYNRFMKTFRFRGFI